MKTKQDLFTLSVFRWTRLASVFCTGLISLVTLNLRADDQVPWKAEWAGHVISQVPTADGGFDRVFLSVGKGIRLGNASELLAIHVTFEVTAEALVVNLAGTATITAANGDVIFATFEGEEIIPNGAPPPYVFTADWEITGGTGRFAGATGSGTSTGLDTLEESAYIDEGTISSVGSNKKLSR